MISDVLSQPVSATTRPTAAPGSPTTADSSEGLMPPVDTFTPSSGLRGADQVASNNMGWSEIEKNTDQAHKLLKQHDYKGAMDVSKRTFDGANSWINYGSNDATDQTMTKGALKKQIDLLGRAA